MNIEENIQKWYELRELINKKEKEMEKYKSEVSKYMIDNELDEIKSDNIRVKKSV